MWHLAIGVLVIFMASTAVAECFGENYSGVVKPEDAEKFVAGSAEFTIDLFERVQKGRMGLMDNIVISPLSLWSGLTTVWHGAKEETRKQMEMALKYGDHNQKQVSILHRNLLVGLHLNETSRATSMLKLLNKVYFDESIQLGNCTLKYLHPEVATLPLALKPAESRNVINQWVEEQTDQTLVEILPCNYIDAQTTMALISAGMFKAQWNLQSIAPFTKPQDFFITSKYKVEVDMMRHLAGTYRTTLSTQLQCLAFEIPFPGHEVCLIVLLPQENAKLDEVVKNMHAVHWKNFLNGTKISTVDLWLPRIGLEQSMELKDSLGELGIKQLFMPEEADLSGFSDGRMYVDFVRHQTLVEVSGGEPELAVTTETSISSEPMVHQLRINRPFIFLIAHKQGAILFTGIIRDPSQGISN